MNPPLMQRRSLQATLALLAAPLLLWPALLNRFPLLFPDSLDYIQQGRPALFAVLHNAHPAYTGMRSAAYALAILPFHHNSSAWPILLLHAAVVIIAVYFATRTILPEHAATATLLTLMALSLCTPLPWYISLLMPDILGPAAYLALFTLAADHEHLNTPQRVLLIAITVLGLTTHTTHLLIAAALISLYILSRLPFASSAFKPSLFLPLLSLAISVAVLLALNFRLYGVASLTGNHPPYLEARLLADGPAARYLNEHCFDRELPFLCLHRDQLSPNDDDFLWGEGLYATADSATQAELLREEPALARAIFHTYLSAQLRISAANALAQLTHFGLDDFDNNTYMQQHVSSALPNADTGYNRSLQARDAVPQTVPTWLSIAAVLAGVAVLAATFRRAPTRLRALTLTAVAVILLNAVLTGVLSEVDARYQARVVWLLPLAAILALCDLRRAQSSS